MESERRLQELLEAVIEGDISAAEHRELAALLKADPAARHLFVDHMKVHGMLKWHLCKSDDSMDLPLGVSEVQEPCETCNARRGTDGDSTQAGPTRDFLRRFVHRRCLAAALLIVAGMLLGLVLRKNESARQDSIRPYVALLKEAVEAEWEGDSLTRKVGTRIRQGDFTVHSGLVELELFDGAVIVVEGPARLNLLSTNRVALEYGNLGAIAGPEAAGFAVETPAVKLVDRGTRFGVRVDESGTTEMEVFSGMVDISLESDDGADYRAHELSAVRINRGDAKPAHIRPGVIRFPEPSQEVARLVDGGFEDGSRPGTDGMPTEEACWSGDPSVLVGADEGIAPMAGNRMLKFIATNVPAEGPDLSRTAASQQFQIVDVRDMSDAIAAGQVTVHAWAHFNRVAGDALTDGCLGVGIHAMQGGPHMTGQMWSQREPFRLGRSEAEILTDGDPSTWQRCEVRLLLPQGTDYVSLQIRAVEDVFNDPSFPEFDGHYADNVGLELLISPKPAGANAGD